MFAYRPLNPRTDTAHLFELICATWTPGASRSRSGIVVMPERRMSSWVITKTAAATSAARCSFRDADVISMFIRSSIDT